MAIYEVFKILLDVRRTKRELTNKIARDVVNSKQVKVPLTNKKLRDRMNLTEESSASRLLNGINHIWSEEIYKAQTEKSDSQSESTLNKELAMSGIEVDDAVMDEGNTTETDADALATLDRLPDYCKDSPWKAGIEKMKKVNYVEVRKASEARAKRKRVMAKFIVAKVKEMTQTETMDIGSEMGVVETAPWTLLVHGLNRDYYE